MEQALRPNSFNSMPSIAKATNEEARAISVEEKQLHAISTHAGWKILRQTIEDLKRDLNAVNKAAIAAGATMEQIGQNTIVVSTVEGILDRLIEKVEDAVESVEKSNGTGK